WCPAPTEPWRAPPRSTPAGGGGRPSAEDVLHLADEGAVLLLLLGRGQGLAELLDRAALLRGQARGHDHADGDVEVAAAASAEVGHALSADAEGRPALRPLRDGELRGAAVRGRHLH